MANYRYTIKDKAGKLRDGKIEASSRDQAVQSLLDQGQTLLSISEEDKGSLLERLSSIGTVPLTEKVLFSQELATLVNAGVPISESLAMLSKQTKNKSFKKVLEAVSADVDSGISFANALEKHQRAFSPLFVSMTRSGEIAGTLDKSLNELSVQMVKERELVSKIRGAMIYPSVIFVGMVGAMIYMLVTIIPKLQDMFNQLHGSLPASTQSLIFLSKAFTQYGIITAIIIFSIYFGFAWTEKNVIPFRKFIHAFLLKVPVIGNLTTKLNIARSTRTLGSLLTSGVSVVESLQIIADSTQNLIFREAFEKTAEKVKNGSSIADVLKTYKIFPALVPQMIAVGEETGSLDVILGKIADFYDNDVDNITTNLSTLLEPMIMIIIGIMVGYFIIAIITPIYSMTNLIQ
jgi:type IV pilus assembly protein PilC